MDTQKTKNKSDVVEGSSGEGSAERSGNAEKSGEKNVQTARTENADRWEEGSLIYEQPGDAGDDGSQRSSPIPGPEDYEDDMDMDFAEYEGYRYGKRRYSQHFDFDYMPLSDPEEELVAPPKINTARRGKPRPSITHSWGLADAEREYAALRAKRAEEEKKEKEKKEKGKKKEKEKKEIEKEGVVTRSKGKERGKKKPAEESDDFLTYANRYAEEVLEEAQRNPPPVSQEVRDIVEKEMRARREIEREVDRELEAVDPEPVAGPSRLTAPSTAGTTEIQTEIDMADLDDRPIEDLKAIAGRKLMTVLTVAAKSGNLQGRYVRDLKDAAKGLREVIDCLAVRPDGEELRRLKTANQNLRRELEEIRREMRELRQELRGRRPSPSPSAPPAPLDPPTPQTPMSALPPALRDFNPEEFLEKIQRMVAVTCGSIVTARIEALGLPPPPIVRPPLAADVRRTALGAPETDSPAVSGEAQESWATVTRRGRKGKGKKSSAPPAVVAVAAPAPVPSGSNAEAPLSAPAPALPGSSAVPSAPKPAVRQKPRIVTPRSSAVIVTLESEAVKRGVSYKDALTEARRSITLEELTVDRVTIRQTATGARIIELFGPESAAKADNLASQLREKMTGIAKVTRPIKCVDVRIVGLDDTIEREEVVAVLAEKSGVSGDQMKVGEIRPGPRGATVVASIPAIGAKKLLDAGRVLIGWSSALVQALDPRPLRCFRCMGVGHTRQLCPCPADRSELCFRCGSPGHKAAGCFEEARCVVCEVANRPFRHTMGGRDCNPPPVKGKADQPGVSRAVQQDHEENEESMSVQGSDRE